jgi:small-conductance mechanosensitive channel
MDSLINNFDKFYRTIMERPLVGTLRLSDFLVLAALLIGVVAVERLFRRYFLARLLGRTQMALPLQFAVCKIIGYLFIAFGFYISLLIVGVNLSSLAVLAGAVGVGLGFGLQNIISNFVSGLIILAERPIAIGDRIEVGGVAGQVRQINMRSTTVVTNDNIAIIVPNADFITSRVTNWSHGDSKVRFRIPLGVSYGSDTGKLQRVLVEVARDHSKVLEDPPPSVFFVGFGDSSLDFELAVWTEEMTHNPRRFRSELLFAIEKKLRENQIEIPFPQRDLHLRSGDFVLRPPNL